MIWGADMAYYKTNPETGNPYVCDEIQKIARNRQKYSKEELELIRSVVSLNRHEKSILTRLIHSKDSSICFDRYSMNEAQRKASKINWLLRQAMGAKGTLKLAGYEIARLKASSPKEELILNQIQADVRAVTYPLLRLILRIKLYNEEKKCSKKSQRS